MAFAGDLHIDIQTDQITRLRQRVNGFIENTPAIEEEYSEQFAEDLVDAIKESVDNKFSQSGSTGNLRDNVRKRRRGGRRFTVSANAYNNDGVNYAAWHEYAENSHMAYFEDATGPNPELIRWAKAVGVYENTWRLEVEPTSFMKDGVQEAISKERRRARTGRNPLNEGLAKAFR